MFREFTISVVFLYQFGPNHVEVTPPHCILDVDLWIKRKMYCVSYQLSFPHFELELVKYDSKKY